MKTELDLSWCDFGGNKIQQTTSTKLNRLKSISDEKLSTICHPIKASPLYNSLPPLPDLIPIKKNFNLINNNYKNSISDTSNNTNYNKSRSCSNLNLSRKNNTSCNNSNSCNDDVCTISREDEYRNCSNSMSPKHCYNEWKPPSVQRPKLQPNNKLIINDDEKYCNMLSKHNNNNNNNCDNKNENINSNCSNNSKSNNRTIRQQKSRHKRRPSLTAANNINASDSTPNKTSNGCAAVEAKSRINPIFLWVKQNDSHIIEVKCEDYDHRNRIRLTKTSSGWKAIPRTEQNSSLSTNSSLESSNSSSGNSCKKNKKKKKKHKKKNKHHHRRKSSIDEEDEEEQEPQKPHPQPKELKLILPHKPLLEPVEMKVELTRIKLDEIEGYDDDDEDDEEPQIIEKAAELVVAVPELVADEEEEEDDDEEENHSVTVIPPDDEEEEEEDIEEIEEVDEVEEVEEVEEVDDHHYNNIINDSTKELMDGIRNMENIAGNTIEVDLLDDDDDDHNESTINGSELIDSLVKQGCEEHNIISSEEDELKNHMDDYNDDDDILLTEEPVVSDIISRLNDSLSSPKCLSFNEAGEIEGISDVFNTHSTSSLDNLSITISEFHTDKSNKNVLDNSNSKIVSPDSCQQDQFHPKDLRICKTNNSSNNISVNSNNSGNVSDNNSISKKNLESPDLSITLISRPISRSSDTIQSPQPSGIPAVPPSPDLLFHKNNFINLNHQFKLPTQKSIQKEPLDLGTSIYRKSASPTVSCSQETERISIESCSPKRIKMEHKSLEKVIENLRSPSQNSMSSISTMTPTPTPSHHNTSTNNIIDLVDIDDDDDNNNNHSIRTNTSKNTNTSSGHFIHRNNDPDPLTQLRLLVSNPEWKVPDPLLVPKDRLNAILESPAREIPLLLTTRPELRLPEAFSFPNILQDPDIMVVSLSQLEMILVKQDELLKAANVVVPTVPPVISNKQQQQQQQQHVPEILDKPTNNCSSLKYNTSSNNSSSSRDPNGKGHVKSKSNSQTQQQQQAAAAAAAVAAAIAPTTNLLPNSLASEIDAATMAAFNQMFWLPYPAGQLNPADLLKIPEINQFNSNFPYQNLPTTNQNNNNSNNNFNGCPPDLSAMLQEAARQMSNNYFLQALKLSQSRWNNNNSSSNQNLHQSNSNNNNSNHSNSNNVTNIKKRPQNMLPQEFIHPQLNHHNNGSYPPGSPRHTNSSSNHNSSNNNNINWNINPNHNYSKLQQSSRSSSSSSSTTTTHNPFASPPYYQDSPQNVFNHHHLGQIPPQHQSTPKIKQQKMSSHHPPHHNNNSNNNHHQQQQQQQQHNNQYGHHNLSANLNHLMSSHKTEKPRVTCKSLLNLLQPNQSSHQATGMQHHPHLQRFNSTGSNESISSEIDMQLHHNNMMNSHNNNGNSNGSSNSNNNNNNHSQAKLKVKPGSHLLDPAAAQRKLLNDDISDVVSTTSGIEDVLNDPNMSLWHPLFGNTQNGNYTSPWHWTTVTATGE